MEDQLSQLKTRKSEIEKRTDLSKEERKKMLRRIRKQIRSAGGSSRHERPEGEEPRPHRPRERSRSEPTPEFSPVEKGILEKYVRGVKHFLGGPPEELSLNLPEEEPDTSGKNELSYLMDLKIACSQEISAPQLVNRYREVFHEFPKWWHISYQGEVPLLWLGPAGPHHPPPSLSESKIHTQKGKKVDPNDKW